MAPPSRLPVGLVVGFGVFVVSMAYLVATSLSGRDVPSFEPTPIAEAGPRPESLVVDTVTLDARDPDRWQWFDFERATPLRLPDTAGWDLAVRRFHVITAAPAADAGKGGFEALAAAPDSGYRETRLGRDTVNSALDDWYSYSLFSHTLEPAGHVYAVRTTAGRFAKLEFLSYYCPGLVAGCVTFRYAYQPNGTPTFR